MSKQHDTAATSAADEQETAVPTTGGSSSTPAATTMTASPSPAVSQQRSHHQNNNDVVKERYELCELIGKGGNAVVYKGKDRVTGDFVAVKKVELTKDTEEETSSELAILRSVDHPNVIKYLDDHRSEKHLYIIMQYAEKGSLLTNLKREGNMSEAAAVSCAQQVLAGLNFLHDKRIIHRDLKAGNVLLCDGKAKLSDFGLAAPPPSTGDKEDRNSRLVGSVYWMAPEAITKQEYTEATDIWGFGCLLVELLTGVPPFFDRTPVNALYHIAESDDTPIPKAFTSSDLCKAFLQACFCRNPVERWTSGELLQHEWVGGTLTKKPQRELIDVTTPTTSAVGGENNHSAATWTESSLFDASVPVREEWFKNGGLQKSVNFLTRITAEESFRVIRALAFAALKVAGTDTYFFDALGETTLWDLDLSVLATPEDITSLFCACCSWQSSSVKNFAASHDKVLKLVLGLEQYCSMAVVSLYKATGCELSQEVPQSEMQQPSRRSSAFVSQNVVTAIRAKEVRERLRADGTHFVLQARIEDVAVIALRTKQDAPGGWGWVNQLLEILLEMGTDQKNLISDMCTDRFLIALCEVTKHQSPAAVRMLVFIARDQPMRIGNTLKVAPYLGIAADREYSYQLRKDVLGVLPLLQRSPAAAKALCDPDTSVPLLAHVLSMVSIELEDEFMKIANTLCSASSDLATACAGYPRFLLLVNQKLSRVRMKNSATEAKEVLTFIELLFRRTSRPELYVTSSEMTHSLSTLTQRPLEDVPPEIARGIQVHAAKILNGLGAQAKMT